MLAVRGRGGCSEGFGIAPRVYNVKMYPTFYEKSFKKGTLKPKIEKRAMLPIFYCFIVQNKKLQI